MLIGKKRADAGAGLTSIAQGEWMMAQHLKHRRRGGAQLREEHRQGENEASVDEKQKRSGEEASEAACGAQHREGVQEEGASSFGSHLHSFGQAFGCCGRPLPAVEHIGALACTHRA